MIKGYKYRLDPTSEQIVQMEKTFGCCRYVYNWALDLKIKTYQSEKRSMSAVDLCKQLTLLKKDDDRLWLNEVSNECLQQSIRCMDSAFTKFFRDHTGFPKFKSKHRDKSVFKNVNSVRFDFKNNRVKISIIGWIKFFANRSFEGKIGTITVSKSSTGKFYASVLIDDGIPNPDKFIINPDTTVGIDVGIKDFAVLSNGQIFSNPKYLESAQKRLGCLQRRMSRRKKGSNRYKKVKHDVAVCHERIRNRRQDFLHKVSKKIVSENQTIIIEDLNVRGMLKNHCLAKGIASVSWSEFFRI
jgi:putative transposase